MANRGIVIKIEGDGESARQALEMVREQLTQTDRKAKESGGILEGAFEEAKRAVEWVGVYEGLRQVMDEFVELTKGSVELGVELGHLSQQTGISVENLSVLRYMSDKTGVGFDELTKGFKKFSVEMLNGSEGQKQATQAFARLGITQQQVKEHGTDMLGMLELVADRFKTIPDGPNKAGAAIQLFGRSGQALIPILNQGREGIEQFAAEARSLGLVMDESGIEKMEQLHAKTLQLQGALQGAAIATMSGLEPALVSLESVLTNATSGENGMVVMGQKMGNAMLGAAQDINYLIMTARKAKAEYESLEAHVDHPGDVFDSHFGFTKGQRASGAQHAADDVRLSQKAVQEYKDAEADYEKTANELAAALQDPSKGGIVGPGMSKAEHARQVAELKQMRDLALQSQGPGAKSDNAFLTAHAALVEEQGNAAAGAQKDADALALAQLEAHHKEMIGSEQDYLAQKLKLQTDEIDAEMKALQQREATLDALYQKQHSDKTLKRDKSGSSAEELRTMSQLQQVWSQMDALGSKRGQMTAANGAETVLANQAAQMNNLRAMAELEKQRGEGMAAQLKLLEAETDLEVKKAAAAGESQQAQEAIRANGQLLEQKLRIADVDRQIQQTEDTFNTAAKEIEDRANKGQITKLAAEKQLNALHQQEVSVLQSLVQQYDALAQTLGGEFTTKAQQLHAALEELSTPDKSKGPQFGKTLADGVTKMSETITRQAIMGKTSFHEMAKEMEADAAELAIKLAMMKLLGGKSGSGAGGGGGDGGDGWLGDLGGVFSGMFKNLPHFAAGGSPDGPSIVGEEGPELWTPPASGGSITPNSTLSKIAEGGGAARAPNVTTNIVNQSSQPVTAQTSGVNYDSQLHEFVQHVVLSDMQGNGPISQGMKGMG